MDKRFQRVMVEDAVRSSRFEATARLNEVLKTFGASIKSSASIDAWQAERVATTQVALISAERDLRQRLIRLRSKCPFMGGVL